MHTNNIVIRGNISPPSEARYRVILLVLFSLPQNTFPYSPPKIPLPILPYIEPHIEKKMAVVYSEKERRERRVSGHVTNTPNFFLFLILHLHNLRHIARQKTNYLLPISLHSAPFFLSVFLRVYHRHFLLDMWLDIR